MSQVFARDMAQPPNPPSPNNLSDPANETFSFLGQQDVDGGASSSLVFRPPADDASAVTSTAPPSSQTPITVPIPFALLDAQAQQTAISNRNTGPSSAELRPHFHTQQSASSSNSTHSASASTNSGLGHLFARRGSVFPGIGQSRSAGGEKRKGDNMEMSGARVRIVDKGLQVGEAGGDTASPNADPPFRDKEEQAMAKWRRWIIEQPLQPTVVGSPIASSPRSRNASPAGAAFPMVPLAPPIEVSPRAGPSTPISPLTGRRPPNHPLRSDSDGTSSDQSGLMPLPLTAALPDGDIIYNTESVRALRDVELAVDGDLLAKATARAASRAESQSRRMSTLTRVEEDAENPFVDLAPRLGSRRVRPIVLELVQALGHYIDAVWCELYPDIPCPWVYPSGDTLETPPNSTPPEVRRWRSRVLTAVRMGKASGDVPHPPSQVDVAFWQAEVGFSLRDVDEVVGVAKGADKGRGKRGFTECFKRGDYGPVTPSNAVKPRGDAGGLARLLNDLEEALWGDAPPRPTDLAYDLPLDFDPYAVPDPEDMSQNAVQAGPSRVRNNGLVDFFTSPVFSPPPPPHVPTASPVDMFVPLPDWPAGEQPDAPRITTSPNTESVAMEQKQPSWDGLGLEAFGVRKEETLEDVGRRRHREWVERRNTVVH